MAITTVYSRMQQKRGLLGDFDASKLLAGEIAVTNDTNTSNQRMYFCISPGTVKRLGTYEDFNQAIADYLATYIAQLEGYVSSASTSASNAHTSESNASNSASSASTSASNAHTSETNSLTSANNSASSATLSESWAIGGTSTRTGEDTNNSKYYCDQAKQAVSVLTNAFVYMGTITFANIPTSGQKQGYTYNISDAFTTDSRFKEGAGNTYTAGTNISYTSDGYWDVLGGKMNDYLRKDGDSATNTTSFTVASTETDIASGDTHATLFGKILKKFGLIGTVSTLNTYVKTSIVNAINWIHTKVINGIASEYSSSSTYVVSSYCYYQGVLYYCTTAITTPEPWTAAHWAQINLSNAIQSEQSDFVTPNSSIVNTNYSRYTRSKSSNRVTLNIDVTLKSTATSSTDYVILYSYQIPNNIAINTISSNSKMLSLYVAMNGDVHLITNTDSGALRIACQIVLLKLYGKREHI